MMQIQIRKMTEKDVPQVAALEAVNFSMPWSEKAFYEQLENKNALYMIAENAEKILGVCGLMESFGEADICNVSVEKSIRNQGIATMMLESLLEEGAKRGINAFTLEVREGNAPAIHLYEKLGFVQEGIRPGFYERPKEDAVIMWKR